MLVRRTTLVAFALGLVIGYRSPPDYAATDRGLAVDASARTSAFNFGQTAASYRGHLPTQLIAGRWQ